MVPLVPLRHLRRKGQLVAGKVQAKPCCFFQLSQGVMANKVLVDEQQAAYLHQTGNGMTMHGCISG